MDSSMVEIETSNLATPEVRGTHTMLSTTSAAYHRSFAMLRLNLALRCSATKTIALSQVNVAVFIAYVYSSHYTYATIVCTVSAIPFSHI